MSGTAGFDAAIDKLPQGHVGRVPLRDATREAIKNAVRDDVPGLAAEMAYRAALALLPFLLLLAALPWVVSSLFSVPDIGGQISKEADGLLSKNSAAMVKTLIGEVTRSTGWQPVLFGLMGTLWAGMSATSAMRKSLNRLYKSEEDKPFLERKLVEFGLTVVAGTLFFAAVVCLLLGPVLLGENNLLTEMLSAGLAVLLVWTAVSLIYWLTPAPDNSLRWIMPGAVFFVAAWLAFSIGFSIYLSRFGSMNRVYGSLGVMIIALIWLYGSNFALLLGAELNVVLGRKFDSQVEAQPAASNAARS